MRTNPVKTRLADGETVFGTMIFEFLSPGLPRMLANSGADFVFYDLEHSGFTVEEMKTQFALCAGVGVIPLARPPGKDYQFTSRLLDVGAFGMLYQMVESAEEAEELVRWNRYPPAGVRGAIFGGAHDDYTGGDIADKVEAAMGRTFTTVLIETQAGLENIDAIMAVDGIDAAHLGHADMSLSMGIPGQFDHPDLQRAVDTIADTASRHGKVAATLAPTPEWGHDFMERGYRMISYSYDMALVTDALSAGINALKRT